MKTYLSGESPSLETLSANPRLARASARAVGQAPSTLIRRFSIPPESSDQPSSDQAPNAEKDNPVLNTSSPSSSDEQLLSSLESSPTYKYKPGEFYRKPGVYMIVCKVNGKRYYGETSDISVRMAKHLYELKNSKHDNKSLSEDWSLHGEGNFEFQVIEMGPKWASKVTRVETEASLIKEDRSRCYNHYAFRNERTGLNNPFGGKNHTLESKKKMSESSKGIPNKRLGSRIEIDGVEYASYSEASRLLKIDRKTIEKRVKSTTDKFSRWRLLSDAEWKNKERG